MPPVRVDGETVYIGDVGMTPAVAAKLGNTWIDELHDAVARADKVARLRKRNENIAAAVQAHGLTDLGEWRHSYRHGRRLAPARQNGIPVLLDEGGRIIPAHDLEQVGPGPAVEFRVPGGRKWRPVLWEGGKATSEIGCSDVAEWRVVE